MGYTGCKLYGQTPTQFFKNEYKDVATHISVVGRQAFVVWGKDVVTVDVITFSVRGDEITWKAMPETWHPYYYDCPAKVLKMLSPTTDANAIAWRVKCWEAIEQKRLLRELEDDDTIKAEKSYNYGGLPFDTFRYFSKRFYAVRDGKSVYCVRLPKGAKFTKI